MKKIFTLLCALTLCAGATTLSAQEYKHAIGLRLGGSAGIDYKQFISPKNSFEVVLDFSFVDSNAIYATGLYEWNTPVIADGFNLYYGAGAHLGLFSNNFALGIDGIVGLEYKFPTIPLAISLDYKPALNFIPDVYFVWSSFGLGIKYTF